MLTSDCVKRQSRNNLQPFLAAPKPDCGRMARSCRRASGMASLAGSIAMFLVFLYLNDGALTEASIVEFARKQSLDQTSDTIAQLSKELGGVDSYRECSAPAHHHPMQTWIPAPNPPGDTKKASPLPPFPAKLSPPPDPNTLSAPFMQLFMLFAASFLSFSPSQSEKPHSPGKIFSSEKSCYCLPAWLPSSMSAPHPLVCNCSSRCFLSLKTVLL